MDSDASATGFTQTQHLQQQQPHSFLMLLLGNTILNQHNNQTQPNPRQQLLLQLQQQMMAQQQQQNMLAMILQQQQVNNTFQNTSSNQQMPPLKSPREGDLQMNLEQQIMVMLTQMQRETGKNRSSSLKPARLHRCSSSIFPPPQLEEIMFHNNRILTK